MIIDEYDIIMNHYPYDMYNSTMNGVWSFKNRKVIAFSATSNNPVERFVNNCISQLTILKFKSEYEIMNGMTPI